MKNEPVILAGIIVVILFVLGGAYVLTGPGPSATPGTVSVTPREALGQTREALGQTREALGQTTPTPEVMPSAVPTAAPAVGPTPQPESGIRQTEYGYWVTYPQIYK